MRKEGVIKMITLEEILNLKKVNGLFPAEARIKFVQFYQQSKPISKQEFCRQCRIDTESLRRWLRLYDDTIPAVECPVSHPSSGTDLCESSTSVTILYSEYQDLQRIKAKYHAICSMCH